MATAFRQYSLKPVVDPYDSTVADAEAHYFADSRLATARESISLAARHCLSALAPCTTGLTRFHGRNDEK